MKRTIILLMALCCLILSPAAKAQNINETYPRELSVGYGLSLIAISANTLIDLAGAIVDLSEADIVSVRSGGSRGIIDFSYLYHTSKVFAIGGNAGFNRISANLHDDTGKVTAASANIYFAMAAAKINWFRYDWFGMYSKFGLGAMCINGNLLESLGGNIWLPTAQISPVCLEAGGRLCGYLELGAGMEGIAQAGVRYHF